MAFLPQIAGDDLEWIRRAACTDVDPNRFFVATGHSLGDDELALCRSCPVRRDCVERAYRLNIRPGYFGGLSPSFRESHTLEETLAFIATDTGGEPADPDGVDS